MSGLLRVVSNSQLIEAEEKAAAERQAQPLVLNLASYIEKCWQAAKLAKDPINDAMLDDMRQRNGEYDAATLQAIREQGGSEIFMLITEVKCRAAESWIRDILLDSGDPPWSLKPTPIPDIDPKLKEDVQRRVTNEVLSFLQISGQLPPPEQIHELETMLLTEEKRMVLEHATERAKRMEDRISDQFRDGGWLSAFNEFITDLVTFPAAFLKGPIVRRKRELDWQTDPATGRYSPTTVDKLIPTWERVDPFRIYPEPGISDIDEGYIIEHHRLSRSELSGMIGLPGYDDGAIRALLSDHMGLGPTAPLLPTEYTKEQLENKQYSWLRPTEVFDAIQFWGRVSGGMLIEWGMSEDDVPDPHKEYDIEAWKINNYVIKAVLNYEPLGRKPYYKTSFIKTPGSFWGKGIPRVIADVQRMCNAAARALSNNMGIASGPQVVVNVDRLPPNEPITKPYPWKVWQVVNDPLGSSGKAIDFEQPNDNAQVLMAVYEKFSRLADDHSGVPAYIYGDMDVQGAGRTSSGLSMLMGAAGKGIRQIIMHIDFDVLQQAVERQYIFNMRYIDDDTIKGDCEIIPMGATNLAVKEQQAVRRLEFLQLTANPIDMEIIGIKGRAAVLREVAKSLNMPCEEIIPSEDKLELLEKAKQAVQAGVPPIQDQIEFQRGPNGELLGAVLYPGGQPQGGMDANASSSRVSGQG